MNAQTRLYLALTYDAQTRLPEAVVWYNRTLALTPMPEAAAEIHSQLGLAYLTLGLVEEAYDMGRKALSTNGGTGLGHGLLGTIFLANGLHTQAAVHLAEQARLSPGDASALHHLGLAQRREAQAEQENVSCQMKLGTSPENPDLLTVLGASCVALGRNEEAVRTLQKAAELDPKNAGAQYQLARAFSAQGAAGQALAAFRRYSDLNPDNSAEDYLNLGCMQARQGAAEEAVLSFERALNLAGENCLLQPWNGASCYLLGRACGKKKLYKRAIDLYRKALILEPDSVRVHLTLAADCLKNGSYRESLEAYRAAYRLTAGRDRTSLTLAESQLAQGEVDKAVQTGLERLRSGQTCYRTYLTLGRAYLAKGNHQEAVSICQYILALSPEEADAHSCLAGSYFGRRSCYKGDWLFARAHACLGNAFMGLARWNDAIASLRKAVDQDPRDAASWRALGKAYEAKGLAQEAADCFRKAGELNPQEAQESHKHAGQPGSADERDMMIARLKRSLETAPDDFAAYKALGEAYSGKGLHDEAVYYLKKALKLRPADSEILMRLGLAHEAKGEEETAFSLYEKAVGLQPENPGICTAAAQRYLGRRAYDKVLQCYSRLQGKALENALIQTHLANARQARGEYGEAMKNYAWLAREGVPEAAGKAYREMALCSLEMKDYENMLQYAHEALLRDPADAELHRHLGDYYFNLGDRDKAMPHYQALSDLAPADAEILARLASIYLQMSREQGEFYRPPKADAAQGHNSADSVEQKENG